MTSLQVSSLEHTEDRSSILSKLKDIDKRLIEIEDNTHPDRGNRSNFRHNRQEKVGLEMRWLTDSYLLHLFLDYCSQSGRLVRAFT